MLYRPLSAITAICSRRSTIVVGLIRIQRCVNDVSGTQCQRCSRVEPRQPATGNRQPANYNHRLPMRSLFFPWGVILQLIAIVHFVRRRPETFWLWIIILFGPLGAFAYMVAEMIPDLGLMRGSMQGFSRRNRIKKLRALVLENPSAGNYEELGELLLEEKKYGEARQCFDHALGSR